MNDESAETVKIRRAPSGKFYVRRFGEVVCLPTGNPRYFETEQEAWAYLAESNAAGIGRIAA
jgi:hypothetical protein